MNTENERPRTWATVAKLTGETKTEAATEALRARPERIRPERVGGTVAGELDEVALHCASLPVLDDRAVEDILDYDERGLPT